MGKINNFREGIKSSNYVINDIIYYTETIVKKYNN